VIDPYVRDIRTDILELFGPGNGSLMVSNVVLVVGHVGFLIYATAFR